MDNEISESGIAWSCGSAAARVDSGDIVCVIKVVQAFDAHAFRLGCIKDNLSLLDNMSFYGCGDTSGECAT